MIEREPDSLPNIRVSSLHLDYGVDAQVCTDDAVEISERGMQIRSRWRFDIGTQISVAIVCPHDRSSSRRMLAEGIVVWCEPYGDEGYESTLLFLELPDELKGPLRELSFQLRATKA